MEGVNSTFLHLGISFIDFEFHRFNNGVGKTNFPNMQKFRVTKFSGK